MKTRKSPRCTRREFIGTLGAAAGLAAPAMALAAPAIVVPGQASGEAPLKARIKVDVDRQFGSIDPNLYGYFIEHFPKCIYGGIVDEGSLLSDAEGIRKDALQAARELRVTQLRWPGGNFVSGYRWREGIGPKEARPTRWEMAWGRPESNRFGTDEFMSYCRKLGTEPHICVNMGDGTLDEAATWVEYCNRAGGTYYSDLRKKNGHAEPYGVKYWGLGNEVWGNWQIGYKNATDYAKAAVEFAKVMRWHDPTIKLIACGNGDPNWDMPVLDALASQVDYLSVHHYTNAHELKRDYYEIMGSTVVLEDMIRRTEMVTSVASAKAKKSAPIAIALDEFAIDNRTVASEKETDLGKMDWTSNQRDVLWVGAALNILQRHCRTVRMANVTFLVNGASPIATTPTATLKRAIYYPMQLYAHRAGKVGLDIMAISPSFSTKNFGEHPYLDVSGSWDEEKRRVTLAVVNRRREGAVAGTIELAGVRARPGGRAFVITAASPDIENTFESPTNITTKETALNASGGRWESRFSPHSLTWLEFEVEA